MIEILIENNRSIAKDGEKLIGECDYKINDDIWSFDHTFVDPSYGGQGIAKRLLDCALEEAKRNNAKVNPICSYVRKVFDKNPKEYCDIRAYSFYGWRGESVKANDENIKNQRHLYDLLTKCWSKETCAPRMRDDWSVDNPTLGQCSITAFLAQDIFGGEVYGIVLKDGSHHCFNKVGDVVFDLTSEQFRDKALDYSSCVLESRAEHFSKEEKYQRYLQLKEKLKSVLL